MAELIKIADAQPRGEYVRTAVDDAKDAADILITGHTKRNRVEIRTRKLLSGPGIKLEAVHDGIGRYLVTEDVMVQLRRRFSVATDF